MVQKLERIDPRILYLSLLVIVVSAIGIHVTPEKTQSILSVFLIIVIAIGNIGCLCRKFKKVH